MSHCKFFVLAAFALCTSPCLGGELKPSDIEVVAVKPRSPDVRPYAMAITGDRHAPAMLASKEQEEGLAKPASRNNVAAAGPRERNVPTAAAPDEHERPSELTAP